MSNPTSNFGWVMPDATDLVTNLPADFEVFGQAVDTSMADLKGGTTGQVLAKASNANMDFVWSADAAGMTNPMTTTGDVIYSSPGSTPVRLGIGSTGQGLSVVAGIPAWSASPTSVLTTTGDTLYASAANTLARRAIGTTGQVLTVAGGLPTWAAAPSPSNTNAEVATSETTTSTSYTDLTTPLAATLTTGTRALVIVSANVTGSASNSFNYMSYAVSGASTIAAADQTAIQLRWTTSAVRVRASAASIITLTAGSNTFTTKYRTDNGANTATFFDRSILVINMA